MNLIKTPVENKTLSVNVFNIDVLLLAVWEATNLFPNKPLYTVQDFWKHSENMRNCFYQEILLFYTFGKFSVIFKDKIALCKLFHFGRIWKLPLTKDVKYPCRRWMVSIYTSFSCWNELQNSLWLSEKMLIKSNFSLCHCSIKMRTPLHIILNSLYLFTRQSWPS